MAFFVEFSIRHERADFLDKLNPCNQMSKMCYRKFPFGVMFDSCCDHQVKYRGQHLATQLISKVAPNESIQSQPQWCVVSARSSFVSPLSIFISGTPRCEVGHANIIKDRVKVFDVNISFFNGNPRLINTVNCKNSEGRFNFVPFYKSNLFPFLIRLNLVGRRTHFPYKREEGHRESQRF